MISVITYGRNDSHGHNLPKRAAISLNCVAELLSDPDDEIIFVDYNTPNDLPTFIEAIYDTLTDRAKQRLRVFRVRPELHRRIYGRRTHLAALEPISRNIAIRRSNPRNRWMLSTNPDMVFVPRNGTQDLTSAVADLADGHYVVPRFDLPETLWEGWPRAEPRAVIRACDELGAALHLNEVSVTYPFMRFDSPGDFQLIPRHTLFEIFGFDERMIHGWHVDSNMCRRMATFFGRTESLGDRLKGYHCDHTRVATLVHRTDLKLENDLDEFVWQMEEPLARHQQTTWGLPDEVIEEVDLAAGPAARYAQAVRAVLGAPQQADYDGDCNDTRNYIAYRSEHILPYLVGYLTPYPPATRFAYVGANRKLFALLRQCLGDMGMNGDLGCVPDLLAEAGDDPRHPAPATTSDWTDAARARELVAGNAVLIVDLGFDLTALPRPAARLSDWPRSFRYRIGAVAELLEACVAQCDELFAASPDRAPDFVLVNANPWVFHSFVSQFLFTAQTPYNIQVRKGRPRMGHDRLYRSHRWKATADILASRFGYGIGNADLPVARPGVSIELTTSGWDGVCADGQWGETSRDGTWIDGGQAELLFAVDPGHAGDLLAQVSFGEIAVPGGEPLRVHVLFQGQRVGRWSIDPRSGVQASPVVLPRRLIGPAQPGHLGFELEHVPDSGLAPPGAPDAGGRPNRPAVMIRSITFLGGEHPACRLGSPVGCAAGQQGAFFMTSGWTAPDDHGAWTLGPHAALTLPLTDQVREPVLATFTISDAAISREFPHLDVDVLVNGLEVDRWRLHGRGQQDRKVLLTPETIDRQRPLSVSFRIHGPRTPVHLNWATDDSRPLGFRLTSMLLAPIPKYKLGEPIDFTRGGNADRYLWSNWAAPDPSGRWTEGEEATLRFHLDSEPTTPQRASFLIADCMVDRTSSPRLPVQVVANGMVIDEWAFGPERRPEVKSFSVPPELMGGQPLTIAFRVPEPRSPASLGWSSDARQLGIHVARACLGDAGGLFVPDPVRVASLRTRARSFVSRVQRWLPR